MSDYRSIQDKIRHIQAERAKREAAANVQRNAK
jgi:hypothetical protein